jgi:probable rRNA maturation factor
MVIINLNVDKKFVLKSQIADRVVDETLKLAGFEKDFEIDISTVNANRIKELNSQYRKVNSPTDVLSFSWQEPKKIQSGFLGEIVLCLPIIIKQARDNKVTLSEELVRLIAHGTLHLVGYDHQTSKEEKEMFGIQEKVVSIVKA